MQDFTGALPGSSSSSESEDEAEKQKRKEEKQARKQVGIIKICAGPPAISRSCGSVTRNRFQQLPCPTAGRDSSGCSVKHLVTCSLQRLASCKCMCPRCCPCALFSLTGPQPLCVTLQSCCMSCRLHCIQSLL